jgi:hypothetical protein
MDFGKTEEFLRKHWPAAVIVALLVAPSAWALANMHFSNRIESLEKEVADLRERVAVLDELEKRSKEKERLAASSSAFTQEELFTPSPSAGTGENPP